MKNTKLFLIKINNIIINILQKLFTVININKTPFKNLYIFILIFVGIIATIILRLNLFVNILNNLPYELMIIIKLTSAIYNILSIFILIIKIKYYIETIKFYFINKDNNLDIISLILYNLFTLYLIFVNLVLFININ